MTLWVNKKDLRKEKHIELFYAVVGRGEFPVDMLRYDQSMPASEVDSYGMQFSYCFHGESDVRSPRVVWLRRLVRDGCSLMPTEARWDSMGWHVMQVSLQSHTPNDDDRKKAEEAISVYFKKKAS
jgi:hypothetical protein